MKADDGETDNAVVDGRYFLPAPSHALDPWIRRPCYRRAVVVRSQAQTQKAGTHQPKVGTVGGGKCVLPGLAVLCPIACLTDGNMLVEGLGGA